MKLFFAVIFSLFTVSELSAQWVPWQIPTPRETQQIPSNGTSITFANVLLPSGMNYHVHADGWITYDASGDVADACFFNNLFLHISPDIGGKLGLKVTTAPAVENWFYTLAGKPNYNQNHIYNASIPSAANTLSIRYYDTDEPSIKPQNYGDNSGFITVEVAQETPRIAVQFDTVFFPNVPIAGSLRKLDSIEAYGVLGYRVDNVNLTGPSAAKFTPSSQRPTSFTIVETTNEFEFVYRPTTIGADTAYFHIYSSNAYGPDQHKIIVLIGNGIGAQLSVKPDTLHFGAIAVNASKTLTEKIYNDGPVAATISSIVMTTPGMPFFFTPSSTTVNAHDSAAIDVTFTPPTFGTFIAQFVCNVNDGSTLTFYADGTAGKAVPNIDKPVLDFGQVVIGRSRSLTSHISNIGNVRLFIDSTVNTNPLEYSVLGAQGPHFYDGGGSGEIYTFTFKPVIHIPKAQNHDGSFIFYFSDGTSSTIVFKGYDHEPLTERLSIDTNYFASPGKEVSVYQRLVDPLDSTIVPERTLSERINFDPAILDFVRIEKAYLLSDPDWKLTTTPSTNFIDVSLTATTKQFGPAGPILRIVFKIRPDVRHDTTYLVQNNINFFDPIEPLASSQTGRIIIGDECTPVSLTRTLSPLTSSIDQNSPNPVTSTTQITFAVGTANGDGAVAVKLYLIDAMGKIIKVLVDEEKTPGYYTIKLDASSLPAGVYHCRLESAAYHGERSIIIVK